MTDIQAVILSDSYQVRFGPITQTLPKVLFPMGQSTIIEHLLDWLAQNGISEIFVLYQSGKELIEAFFAKKKLKKVSLLYTINSRSVGDALRELESHKVIHQDLLIIHGDIITNMSLKAPIEAYLKNKSYDRMNIMLMILNARSDDDKLIFTIDSNNQLLQLNSALRRSKIEFAGEKIKLEKGISTGIKICSQLSDSGIYICSRDVLKSFQENSQYEDIKEHFVYHMLTSEIQEEKIHVHICQKHEVSQRITHPRALYEISQKYIQRHFSPKVPENEFILYEDLYKYIGLKTSIDSQSTISDKTYIGQQCKILKSQINRSFIGNKCQIINSQIKNCIIWDNVTITDCNISNTLIANDCVLMGLIANGTMIPSGFSGNVVIQNQVVQGQNMGDQPLQPQFVQSLDESDSELEEDRGLQRKKKQSESQNEDMILLEIANQVRICPNEKESIQQALTNVELMKVQKNKSTTEIIDAFMPVLLQKLQPNIDSLKQIFNIWDEFLKRFISGDIEVQAYSDQLEKFCRDNPNFYLHQLLQLSYSNQSLSAKQIVSISNAISLKQDEFAISFTQLNENFLKYMTEKIAEEEEYDYEYYEEGEEGEEEV